MPMGLEPGAGTAEVNAGLDDRPETGDGGEGRRRRRRGGRGRGRDGAESVGEHSLESSDESIESAAVAGGEVASSPVSSVAWTAAPEAARDVAPNAAPVAADVAAVHEVPASPTPVSAAPTAATTAAPSAPVERAASRAPAEPFVLPIQALQSLAAEAGLQWVHSDAQKVQAAQDAIAHTPKAPHVPRAPKPRVQVDEGPLVLVETRKDLSQVRMPFDAN